VTRDSVTSAQQVMTHVMTVQWWW